MKKLLLLLSIITVTFSSCDEPLKNLTPTDLSGKWAMYESVELGKVQYADLSDELSYIQFRPNGTLEDYSYYYNDITYGSYDLSNNVIRSNMYADMQIVRFNGVTLTVEHKESKISFMRTDNTPMLYLEPSVKFQSPASIIKLEEKRAFLENDGENLLFASSKELELGVIYLMKQGKMTASATLLSITKTDPEELFDFISSKYMPLGQISETSFAFKSATYMVIIDVSNSGVLVMYTTLPNYAATQAEISNKISLQTKTEVGNPTEFIRKFSSCLK